MKNIVKYFLIMILFLSCSSSTNYEKKEYKNLKNGFKDLLKVSAPQDNIIRLELIISGFIKNKSMIKLGHKPYNQFEEIKLKKGIINKVIEREWYTSEALIEFKNSSVYNDKDSLNIKYKFY